MDGVTERPLEHEGGTEGIVGGRVGEAAVAGGAGAGSCEGGGPAAGTAGSVGWDECRAALITEVCSGSATDGAGGWEEKIEAGVADSPEEDARVSRGMWMGGEHDVYSAKTVWCCMGLASDARY